MKKLYIHIGPHKTGSTYIQKSLFENRTRLLEGGLDYPDLLVGPQWGHHKLVEAIKRREQDVVQQFVDSLSQKSLISSENFENLHQNDINFLATFLSDFEVEVIFVKRSFSDLIISNWQESVKHGSEKTWSFFILEQVLRPFSSIILNQSATIDKWRTVTELIHIINYDLVMKDNEDLLVRLLQNIDVNPIEFPSNRASINASLNYIDVEIIRILNSIHRRNGFNPSADIRTAFLSVREEEKQLISKIKSVIKKDTIIFRPDESWCINFFEKSFANTQEYTKWSKIQKDVGYELPNQNSSYLIVISKDIEELYSKVTEAL